MSTVFCTPSEKRLTIKGKIYFQGGYKVLLIRVDRFSKECAAQESKREVINLSLGKHAYSNILKISPPKTGSFQIKILIFFFFFHISAQNIDCGHLGEAVVTSTPNL